MADDRICNPVLIAQGPILHGQRYAIYSFTCDSDDTGGSINTGMKKVLAAFACNTTAAAGVRLQINTDESGPKDGWVKITVAAGNSGYIMAIGYGISRTRS